MRWWVAALALIALVGATPALGSFHETLSLFPPDRTFVLAMSGTTFDGLSAPHAPLLEAYLGERARFTLVATEAHTFHLHGHPWLLNSRTFIDTFLVTPETPHVFDVIAGGPDGHPGDWMYHCHMDEHLRGGMWGVFRVYPYMTRLEKVPHAVEVTLERLGAPLEGARLRVEVDGTQVLARIDPQGHGLYVVRADLPARGVLVVTAEHPEHGTSVARLPYGGAAPPIITIPHVH